MSTRNELIADLLMGAAFSDDKLEGVEYEAVKKALALAMRVDEIPPVLAARLEWFQPAEFDLGAAVRELALETTADKRQLLELIVLVQEADEVIDLDEDAYLRRVAEAMGLAPEDYADLTIEDLSIERGPESILNPPPLPEGMPKPPPLPADDQ
ncbi:MAG: TerB family tellurite resistance protein [Deltaproteobacteria bacterium]|jgi:uncharacterized tellurite resistance protein B-like protein|nr:TerB family tellurite resistance protein [Deltaproteobacteria bacterium]MBW2532684.1 TerB family tellurite resistance protein [Deltaproteobacteria bacterium]